LWINTKWVSGSHVGEDTILDGQLISGQTLGSPLRHLDLVSQESLEFHLFVAWNLLLEQVLLPIVEKHSLTKNEVERSSVRKERGSCETVTDELKLVLLEAFHIGGPTSLFGSETLNKLFSGVKLLSHKISHVFKALQLIGLDLLVSIKDCERVVKLFEDSFSLCKILVGSLELGSHLLSLLTLGLNILENVEASIS